jgi:mRNA interferase YafQ
VIEDLQRSEETKWLPNCGPRWRFFRQLEISDGIHQTVRIPISGAQFRRDVKLAERRGKDLSKLREAVLLLVEGAPLPLRLKDHPLSGDWAHYRDCHLKADWLLLYKVDGNDLYLVRTGTHSDLF